MSQELIENFFLNASYAPSVFDFGEYKIAIRNKQNYYWFGDLHPIKKPLGSIITNKWFYYLYADFDITILEEKTGNIKNITIFAIYTKKKFIAYRDDWVFVSDLDLPFSTIIYEMIASLVKKLFKEKR